LLSKGQDWFGQRRMITPAFHFNILEDFIEVFDKQTNKMIDLLRPFAEKSEEINMYNYVTLCALDIISGMVRFFFF
jgi:cytochrome P450 family 4